MENIDIWFLKEYKINQKHQIFTYSGQWKNKQCCISHDSNISKLCINYTDTHMKFKNILIVKETKRWRKVGGKELKLGKQKELRCFMSTYQFSMINYMIIYWKHVLTKITIFTLALKI